MFNTSGGRERKAYQSPTALIEISSKLTMYKLKVQKFKRHFYVNISLEGKKSKKLQKYENIQPIVVVVFRTGGHIQTAVLRLFDLVSVLQRKALYLP